MKVLGVTSARSLWQFPHVVLSTVGNKHKRDQVEDVQVAVSIHLSRMVLITPMLAACATNHKSTPSVPARLRQHKKL